MLGFLGYLGLVLAMFFLTDYLKDDDKTEGEVVKEEKSKRKETKLKVKKN
jgi:hypothetical protein